MPPSREIQLAKKVKPLNVFDVRLHRNKTCQRPPTGGPDSVKKKQLLTNAVRSYDADRFWEALTCQHAQQLTASKKATFNKTLTGLATLSGFRKPPEFFDKLRRLFFRFFILTEKQWHHKAFFPFLCFRFGFKPI